MEQAPTSLSLPRNLPYPITIQRIHAKAGSTVQKTQSLLSYSFIPAKPDNDGKRERQVRVWESPLAGQVDSWAVREGDLVGDNSTSGGCLPTNMSPQALSVLRVQGEGQVPPDLRQTLLFYDTVANYCPSTVTLNCRQALVRIREPCTHDVQLHGLCALCGKDLNATDYTGFSDTSRATISMVHDVGGLTVSLDEAHRLESATTRRLLSAKKLSLIVDLDQTIVHATVDPTVGEWLQDPKNPNYKALEGVGKFKLVDEAPAKSKKRKRPLRDEPVEEEEEDVEEGDGCWYYIKMRPGLTDFLKRISRIYEMHVYTMGTRAYAKEVCKVIDPDGGLFGGRILSRDESGSMTRKSLQRLFPCDTNMVVIIDDRADVWDGSPHLVKTIPYEFFVGIGDINAAFLPKKKDLVPPPTQSASSSPSSPSSPQAGSEAGDAASRASSSPSPDIASDSGSSAGEHLLPTSVAAEPTTVSDLLVDSAPSEIVSPSLDEASTVAALAIHDIVEARPLEKAQREADAHHHAHHPSPHPSENGEKNGRSTTPTPPEDEEDAEGEDEEEEAVLKDDDRELDRLFDILSTIHGKFYEQHARDKSADVANIIPALKQQTLRSTHLVFSGLVALGSRPEDSEYWKLARTFGARCSADLTSSVTHLVANQAGTAKVHAARRNPRIKVVYSQWLLDSVAHWTRLPESSYLLADPETTSPPGSPIRPDISEDEATDPPLQSPPPNHRDADERDGVHAEDIGDSEYTRDGDLELADVDWGDAMKEVDDLLNETDDEDTASLAGGEGAGEESDTGSIASSASRSRARKRPRLSIEEKSNDGGHGEAATTESPLQKRVKTARSRTSGLKTSLSAAAVQSAPSRPPFEETALPASSQASQASSSPDSDDDDLLASMVAEVEKGF